MSLLRRLIGAFREKSVEQWIGSTIRMGEVASARFGGHVPSAELVSRATQWAMVCADFNAMSCSQQRLRLYRPARSRGRAVKAREQLAYLRGLGPVRPHRKAVDYARDADDIEEVRDHPALELLENPNEWQSGSQFDYQRFVFYEIAGESYVYMDDGAYILAPQWTAVQMSERGFVTGYWYGRDRSDVTWFPADSTMHMKLRPSPFDPFHGLSPMSAVQRELDLYRAATEAETARWMNGGRPDYLVKLPPGSTEKQAKQAEAELSKHRGPRNAGRWLVGMVDDIKPLSFTALEMEYVKGMERIERAVWSAFGVPEPLLRMNDANLAASRAAMDQYARLTIMPRLNADADNLTRYWLPKFGIRPGEMWFVYDNPVPADDAAMTAQHVAYLAAGVLTVNEVRAEIGREPLEGGDEPRRTAAPAPAAEPETDASGVVRDDRDSGDDAGDDPEDDGDSDDDGGGRVPASKSVSPPRYEAIGAAFERRLSDIIGSMSRGIRYTPGGTPDLREIQSQLEEVFGEFLPDFLRDGLKRGAADPAVPVGFAVSPVRADEFMLAYKIRLAGEVTDTLSADINAALRTRLDEGATLNDALADVQNLLGDEAPWRAERIARTEVVRATNSGHLAALREASVPKKAWLLAGEPCELCAGIAARGPVGVDEVFVTAGEVVNGVVAPWTVQCPSAHPNCRCAVVGVRGEA